MEKIIRKPTGRCTVQELAKSIFNLEMDIEFNFSLNEDGSDFFGVIRKRIFDGDILLLGYYRGSETSMFNLINQQEDKDLIDWLEYCINKGETETIYLFESEKQKLKEEIDENIVSSFFYYMWNSWYKEECQKIFGWEHFWNKWIYHTKDTTRGAAEKFYNDLDTGNRIKLVKRACEVYDGSRRRKEDEK
ncbi:MAG: hypothetical protein LBQ74_19940 [Prevotella sp.]|jgi:hypothetical protein|nr:hypothetical protein [Prevotella sp.]